MRKQMKKMYKSLQFKIKMSELKPSGEKRKKKKTQDGTFSKYQGNKILNISKRKSRLPLKTKQNNGFQNGIKIVTSDPRCKKKMEIFYFKGK